jgi:DNA-binding MarR family transcriptional regulator
MELREQSSLGVGQLAERIGRHQSLVSRHCTRLKADGLIVRRNPTSRPSYSLTDYGREFLAFVMRD